METEHGPGEVLLDRVEAPELVLAITHGAGGGVESADLLAVRDAVVAAGGVVARVLQPFRVAGRPLPGGAARQDRAWTSMMAALTEALRREYGELPLVVGGRSNGARVACRTAREVGAAGVVALAFPVHPPRRPERSRATELAGAGVPVLAVSGDRDPFGVPAAADVDRLVVLAGEGHELMRDPTRVGAAVAGWLGGRGGRRPWGD
nr:alpha/beta family hydrolase [Rhizohabitans arisaemae]